jgi:hypothetical protein
VVRPHYMSNGKPVGKVQRNLLTLGLLVVWAAGMVWAFWWYEGQYLRSFDRPAYFSGTPVPPPFEPGQVQVVHVWQTGCPCNGGHQVYLEEMTRRFGEQGVRFARSGQVGEAGLPTGLKELPYWPIPEQWASWPGAPAIVIWNAGGELAYVGPYSDGAHCSRDSSFVEPVIGALLSGRPVSITTQDTVSCLCDIE